MVVIMNDNFDEKNNLNMIIDGPSEIQRKCVEKFLSTLTDEEKERSMSSEFDYLEEE